MIKKTLYVTGLLAASGAATLHAGVMLSNFEDNTTDGWQSYAGNGMTVVSAPAAGLGSYSLLETVNSQYWGQLTMQSWANSQLTVANLNAGSQVSLDLYFASTGWLVNHANVNLEIQDSGGLLGTQDTTVSTSLSSINFNSVTPVTFNLSSFNIPLDPTATSVNLMLYVQPGYDWMWDGKNPNGVAYTGQQVYLDNVQITAAVPEPASTAILAAAGAVLMVVRRRAGR